jgi:hypothetical protein
MVIQQDDRIGSGVVFPVDLSRSGSAFHFGTELPDAGKNLRSQSYNYLIIKSYQNGTPFVFLLPVYP